MFNQDGYMSIGKRSWPDGGLMLGQRRRLWSSIKPSLGQCFLMVGSEESWFAYMFHAGIPPGRGGGGCGLEPRLRWERTGYARAGTPVAPLQGVREGVRTNPRVEDAQRRLAAWQEYKSQLDLFQRQKSSAILLGSST